MRGKLIRGEPLARYTSFRIGGEAELFFVPVDEEDLKAGLVHARDQGLPWFILGNGSNILVSDEGIKGMVVHLASPAFRQIRFNGNSMVVGAGAKTGTVLHEAVDRGFGGIEFLGAVPGTLGGVFYMNAGTYLGEIAGVAKEVRVLNQSLESVVLPREALEYDYRSSVFQKNPWVILEGKMALVPMMKKEAQSRVMEILDRRRKTQPLRLPSAGSAFKNPSGASAWQLIERAGLRGFSVGDAVVSEVHANFVINKGSAKASEVFKLMRTVQERVLNQYGVLLEPEVRLIGEWKEDFLRSR